MLTDEQVISVKRERDRYLKMIQLVRLTCNGTREMYEVFRDIHKINNFNEKILYLLFVYIKNSDEDIMSIIEDTDIISNSVVYNFLENGIRIDELNSDILKNYLMTHGGLTSTIDLEKLDDIEKDIDNAAFDEENIEGENKKNCYVDYNLRHLDKENIKEIESRNQKMKKKIRRKTLYDKYQGR